MNPSSYPLPPHSPTYLIFWGWGGGAESRLNKAASNNTRGLWVWYVRLHGYTSPQPHLIFIISLGYSKETAPLSLAHAFAYVSTYKELPLLYNSVWYVPHTVQAVRRQVFTLKNHRSQLLKERWTQKRYLFGWKVGFSSWKSRLFGPKRWLFSWKDFFSAYTPSLRISFRVLYGKNRCITKNILLVGHPAEA